MKIFEHFSLEILTKIDDFSRKNEIFEKSIFRKIIDFSKDFQ